MAKPRSTRKNLRRNKKRSTRKGGGGLFSVGKNAEKRIANRLAEEKRRNNRLKSPEYKALVNAAVNAAKAAGKGKNNIFNKNGKPIV
jgi:hypothetical protein